MGLNAYGQASADHPCAEAGDAPTVTITDPAEVVTLDDGTHIAGVGMHIHFAATLTDSDMDHVTKGDTGTKVDDTFDKDGAIKWSEQNGGGDFLQSTTKNCIFTTVTPGDYTIILKIKDDGEYFLDFAKLTQVATYHLKVVYPDGVKVVSQTTSVQSGANILTGATMKNSIKFQVTYQDKPLQWTGPWVEIITFGQDVQQVLPLPYQFPSLANPQYNGDWQNVGTVGNDGTFTDPHTTGIPHPFGNNTYGDGSCMQEIGFTDKDGNNNSIEKFKVSEYLIYQSGTFSPSLTIEKQ